jgi:hypothetical protein
MTSRSRAVRTAPGDLAAPEHPTGPPTHTRVRRRPPAADGLASGS